MLRKLTFLVALAVMMVPSLAFADACTDNGTTSFCLDEPNQGQFLPGELVIHVTLNGSALNVHIGSSDPSMSNLRIDMVGFNSSNSSNGNPVNLFAGIQPTGGTVLWDTNGGCQMDGFGCFNSNTQGGGNNSNNLTWNLTQPPTFTGDEQFVVHVRYERNGATCSAFVSNLPVSAQTTSLSFNKSRETTLNRLSRLTTSGGGLTSEQTAGEVCGGTEVPEPGSLALLGTGLLSAVGILRRRLNLGA